MSGILPVLPSQWEDWWQTRKMIWKLCQAHVNPKCLARFLKIDAIEPGSFSFWERFDKNIGQMVEPKWLRNLTQAKVEDAQGVEKRPGMKQGEL